MDIHTTAYILSKITLFIKKLITGEKNSATKPIDGGTSTPIAGEATSAIQAAAPVPQKPVSTLKSRVTKEGFLAGLIGVVLGLSLAGYPIALATGELFAYICVALLCSPYPLIGAGLGVLIGRIGLKRHPEPEDNAVIQRYTRIGGGIVGVVVGVLPILLILLYFLLQGEI